MPQNNNLSIEEIEEKRKAAHREAQRKYREKIGKDSDKEKFKNRTLTLKVEEDEQINSFCEERGIKRNTLIRQAVMEYIEKGIIERNKETIEISK